MARSGSISPAVVSNLNVAACTMWEQHNIQKRSQWDELLGKAWTAKQRELVACTHQTQQRVLSRCEALALLPDPAASHPLQVMQTLSAAALQEGTSGGGLRPGQPRGEINIYTGQMVLNPVRWYLPWLY